ncbi:hypothetical protein [Algiphilus sp.]|uniref:hypothetical protein n=1 Tax=Algiphilus sp. TaxID=1872431 RepID=UPI0025C49374|nr:hypothetical protein [Algiphilus sp.]MCK5770941.1 hypothetical protein [Algiphilus sp.]
MAVTLGGISLPDDIVWLDELAGPQVAQARARTLGGGQVIEETALLSGRPITLGGGVWASRSTVLALRTLAADAGETHTLDLRGDTYTVAFVRPNPIEATPVIRYADPAAEDPHELTVRLIEV